MNNVNEQTEKKNSPKKDRPMREISVEGCEVLGMGGNGAVYRLDDETIVKVYFSKRRGPEEIDRNRAITKAAFVNGIPTMIAFDMVRVGENYGVIYENINAKSLSQEIAAHPEKLDEYAHMIVETMKKLHSTEFATGTLPNSKDKLRQDILTTEKAGYYKPEQVKRLLKLVDDIPDRNTFIHQDFHPGNLMLQNGEIVLIDVDDSGLGHPILDLAAMHMVYVTAAKTGHKISSLHLTKDQFARVWRIILEEYFNTKDDKKIAEIERIISGYAMISLIKGVATSPNVKNWLRRPVIAVYKRKFFKMIDSLHAIPS